MPTYIVLIRFTEKGIEGVRHSEARVETIRSMLGSLGVELREHYLVMGQYDAVAVVEAPDDETATRASLAVASRGNIRTETLRAFPEEEYRRVLADLP